NTVSAYDAALILQYVVGLIDEFPADSMGSPSAIEPRDYELSLPKVEAPAGEKIQVPIGINDATGLLAGGVTIKYDQTVLRAIGYGSLELLNGYYWKANTDLPGEVRFAFATTFPLTPALSQKEREKKVGGKMLMVEFEVLPNAEGETSPLILENVDLSNSRSVTKIDGEVRVIPTTFALLQNFPNPFNPDTWLPYKLASDSSVSISIYNAKGQLIRTLHLGYQNAGVYATRGKAAYWDGKDNLGEKVSSGVYFYTLRTGEFISTRKMVIVK
ncbi:TPA: T9SS type A sorting domain-containing protein, partial [Candidatus Poribacteria bacterium]|nr:T9SS type A sorting domain-containing protein [Candidatus Poribacteria bacterium]